MRIYVNSFAQFCYLYWRIVTINTRCLYKDCACVAFSGSVCVVTFRGDFRIKSGCKADHSQFSGPSNPTHSSNIFVLEFTISMISALRWNKHVCEKDSTDLGPSWQRHWLNVGLTTCWQTIWGNINRTRKLYYGVGCLKWEGSVINTSFLYS